MNNDRKWKIGDTYYLLSHYHSSIIIILIKNPLIYQKTFTSISQPAFFPMPRINKWFNMFCSRRNRPSSCYSIIPERNDKILASRGFQGLKTEHHMGMTPLDAATIATTPLRCLKKISRQQNTLTSNRNFWNIRAFSLSHTEILSIPDPCAMRKCLI